MGGLDAFWSVWTWFDAFGNLLGPSGIRKAGVGSQKTHPRSIFSGFTTNCKCKCVIYISMCFHDFEGMKKTWNAIWTRSMQDLWHELCSGFVWWRKRCSVNIDNYLRDRGRGNQNRTFELLQPEGCKNSKVRFWCFIYEYIYIYTCASLRAARCIYMYTYIYINVWDLGAAKGCSFCFDLVDGRF